MAIDVSIKNNLEKKTGKTPDPRDRGMVTAGPGQKHECRPPSSIKLPLIDGWRTPGLELLPFQLLQIRWRGTEGGKFSFLTSDVKIKKEAEFAHFRSAPSYLRRSGKQQF